MSTPAPSTIGRLPRRARVVSALSLSAALLSTAAFSGVLSQSAEAAGTCPAQQIRIIWDGGSSADRRCHTIADRLDHLFYPGYQTTARHHGDTYRENTVFIQLRLRDLGYRAIVIDGFYGEQSARTVRQFQRNENLVVDGVVGLQTWKKLFGLGRA